ncbi:MAG TPA: hypothetical protein VGP40_02490 [Chthoniobacterales bacterium]|nr:hypothetical protein [Chthoniobacterales bacterium]
MRTLRWLICCIALVALGSCVSPSQPGTRRVASESFAAAPENRPGLGTGWGETRESRSVDTRFQRANLRRPSALAKIYYNDAAGIRAMAGATELRRTWPVLAGVAENFISVGLRDESGRFLPGLVLGDRWFVVGEQGRRYSIVVRNRSELRLEVLLSVDGLDVLDGRKASFAKRGYVIRPYGELTIDGFRRSTEAVAAFRFSSVQDSYANQKHADTRNVGVIGIALFHEYGTDPLIMSEAERRLRANPFPGRFATPPEPMPVPRRP